MTTIKTVLKMFTDMQLYRLEIISIYVKVYTQYSCFCVCDNEAWI